VWLSSCCRCRRAAWYRDVLCRTVDQSSCRGMFSMAFSSDRSMVNHQNVHETSYCSLASVPVLQPLHVMRIYGHSIPSRRCALNTVHQLKVSGECTLKSGCLARPPRRGKRLGSLLVTSPAEESGAAACESSHVLASATRLFDCLRSDRGTYTHGFVRLYNLPSRGGHTVITITTIFTPRTLESIQQDGRLIQPVNAQCRSEQD